MRSQNKSFSAPAAPAVSTSENREALGASTEAFSHSDRSPPATISRRAVLRLRR
jgi:hypothetical protein